MKERPILFSSSMIKALLAGAKTQTRRIVKAPGKPERGHKWSECLCRQIEAPDQPCVRCLAIGGRAYANPGDRLWVKETWRMAKSLNKLSPSAIGKAALDANYSKPWAPIEYVADGKRDNWEESFGKEPGKTRVSIHMPRWASRITLKVTGVRVERLQAISREDCRAEGIDREDVVINGHHEGMTYRDYSESSDDPCEWFSSPIDSYVSLWESINGEGSWKANPWVWVINFEVAA